MSNTDSHFEQALSQRVHAAITEQVFPGMEILVAKGKDVLFHEVFGTYLPDEPTSLLTKNSLFDLASLTKPLATTLAILHLVERQHLKLHDSLQTYLPEFKQQGVEQITLKHLLTHTSGLPAWIALFQPEFNPDSGWKKLVNTALAHKPGEACVYSCLGFIILAEIVRRVSGESLNHYCRKHIYHPLHIHRLLFNPVSENPGMPVVPTGFCTIRQQKLVGQVHDENAALFYGEGGNSGLFGIASDIHKLCTLLIDSTMTELHEIISQQTLNGMFVNQNKPSLLPRSLGWDYKLGEADYWSCSERMPNGSIGHLGFTGTSLWIDSRSKLIILLLSNRVILSREGNIPKMRDFRPQVHSLVLSEFLL